MLGDIVSKIVKSPEETVDFTVRQNIDDFDHSLSDSENLVAKKLEESRKAITDEINKQTEEVKACKEEIEMKFDLIARKASLCKTMLPSQEVQRNKLVETLEKRDLDELFRFITAEDPNRYFPPVPIQTMPTLLSFIQQTTFLVGKNDLVLEWISYCLMNLDIHQPLAKRFLPTLFKRLDDEASKINTKQARAVRFVIDSLKFEIESL